LSEEGNVNKKKVAKVAAGLLASGLFVGSQQDVAEAHASHHSSLLNNINPDTGGHSSWSSHSTGGWC